MAAAAVQAEMSRMIALEATVTRGGRANFHELWAAIEAMDDVHPRLIVDVWSGPAVLWAWWQMGAEVIAVTPESDSAVSAFSGSRLPSGVTELVGDPTDPATALRVADQVGGRDVDVLVMGLVPSEEYARTVFAAYSPRVRERGLVLVHGIAASMTGGGRAFWGGLGASRKKELIGSEDPIGYGVVEIHGKDRVSHV